MTGQTYDFLRRFNIGDWLVGFNILGDAIDIVIDDRFAHRMTDYYGVLSQKYGRDRKRERMDVMERMMEQPLNNPPSARKFIYAAADYLNSKKGRKDE